MIGERIKQIRNELKFNQNDFASKLNIKQQALSYYENKNEFPNELLKKITIEFRINPDWLLTGRGGMFIDGLPTAIGRPGVPELIRGVKNNPALKTLFNQALTTEGEELKSIIDSILILLKNS